MGNPSQTLIRKRLPLRTLTIVLVCALTALSPELARFFIFDRQAILAGAWWRLFTGHLVHFSNLHLFYDLTAFALTGWLIEQRRYPGQNLLYPLLALAISTALLIAEPDMDFYGGLSGMACGAIVFAALHGLGESRRWAVACAGALILLCGKLLSELLGVIFLPGLDASGALRPVPASHVTGTATAVVLFACLRARERWKHNRSIPAKSRDARGSTRQILGKSAAAFLRLRSVKNTAERCDSCHSK